MGAVVGLVLRAGLGTGLAAASSSGVAGCFSLHEYDHHLVKKHEHTRPDKEDDRTKHLIRLRAQTDAERIIGSHGCLPSARR